MTFRHRCKSRFHICKVSSASCNCAARLCETQSEQFPTEVLLEVGNVLASGLSVFSSG